MVTFPDAELRSGPDTPATAFRGSVDFEQGLQTWLSSRVQLSIAVTVVAAGSADLHLGLVPIQNPQEGQVSWTIHMIISP